MKKFYYKMWRAVYMGGEHKYGEALNIVTGIFYQPLLVTQKVGHNSF